MSPNEEIVELAGKLQSLGQSVAVRDSRGGYGSRQFVIRRLANELRALDGRLLTDLWGQLPESDEPGVKPESLRLPDGVDRIVVHSVLNTLREQGDAQMAGGWWKKCAR